MLDPGEDFFHATRHNAAVRIVTGVLETLHRVRLTCACLAIRKNGGVVTLQDRSDGMLGRTFINMLLRRVHVVDVIEAVGVPYG